jgi:glycosyltransferase involved in cell wall biosynthesis
MQLSNHNVNFVEEKKHKASVAIVQRLVPHYRLAFFKLLTEANPDLEIVVYHSDKGLKNGDSLGFAARYYRGYTVKPLGFTLVVQPRLTLDILRVRPKVLVIEGTFGVLTNFILLLFRWISGLPTLYWTAGWHNPEITGWKLRLKTLYIGTSLKFSSGAIVYGSSAYQYLIAHGVPGDKIIVAQNTIDVESLISQRSRWVEQGKIVRQQHGLMAPYLVSYVGHLAPMKRVHVLLEAFRILHTQRDDIALLIVGAGEQQEELKGWVRANPVADVHFVGEVVDGVEAFFAASDLFVLPGTGGLALNQAMALGLPVIATVADGTQLDLIRPDENGYIIPVDDVKGLADAIERALKSPEHLKRLGENSLRIIEQKATLTNMVKQFSYAIRQAL